MKDLLKNLENKMITVKEVKEQLKALGFKVSKMNKASLISFLKQEIAKNSASDLDRELQELQDEILLLSDESLKIVESWILKDLELVARFKRKYKAPTLENLELFKTEVLKTINTNNKDQDTIDFIVSEKLSFIGEMLTASPFEMQVLVLERKLQSGRKLEIKEMGIENSLSLFGLI